MFGADNEDAAAAVAAASMVPHSFGRKDFISGKVKRSRLGDCQQQHMNTHHFVALHLVPLSTGQPPCSAPESSRPSVCRLQNATAEPALGFTAKPFIAHAE